MLKKKYTNINIPFLEPVDPIALGVPDYYNVITNPMDLSTLRKKLESGEYETADQFEHDCRLIFSNCYTYNHPDSEVYKMGQSHEEVFNNKWKHRPITKDSSSGNFYIFFKFICIYIKYIYIYTFYLCIYLIKKQL